ncbi:glycoside hydrolase family 16 protein, partial [Aspergillus saccharolyticus JOP 1030-1]
HQQCDCYLISGPDPGYFTHYKLWDFRNASQIHPQPASPRTVTTNITTLLTPDADTDNLYTTMNLFSQTPFSKDWRVQTWGRAADPLLAPIPMTNSESNVFMHTPRSSSSSSSSSQDKNQQPNSFLVLRTTRFINHATTAEIESQFGLIDHCSLRLHMPPSPAPPSSPPSSLPSTPPPHPGKGKPNKVPSGTCAGVFTYRSSTCESDIEILTSDDPHTIHYANQPDYDPINDRIIPGASAVVNLTRPWTEWTTHRLDWLTDQSRWYADNVLQTAKRYRVPDQPSIIVINLWSNGGAWTGDLRVGESVYLGIEWMELVYNLSSSSSSSISS